MPDAFAVPRPNELPSPGCQLLGLPSSTRILPSIALMDRFAASRWVSAKSGRIAVTGEPLEIQNIDGEPEWLVNPKWPPTRAFVDSLDNRWFTVAKCWECSVS